MKRLGLTLVLLGCGPTPQAGDGADLCHWCAAVAPFVRVCESTMIASGGQLVCVDDGEARLCEAPSACRP